MEITTANAAFTFAVNKPLLLFPSSSRTITPLKAIKSSSRNSLSTDFVAPSTAVTSSSSHFSGHKLRPPFLNPAPFQSSGAKRSVVTMVIPFQRGPVSEQPPPDLASYLYKNRIVYLGMPLVPAVTELMAAEFLYLQYDDDTKPIYMYINSTGTVKGGQKLGYETEALAVYDLMRLMKPPIFTLCVGNAWGEAAILLAAGAKGNRSALPSTTIMIREPITRFQGQATDVDIARKEITRVKADLVKLLATHTQKTTEQIEADIRRPKYFSPSEAVEYGIIDKVLYNKKASKDHGVVSDLQKAQLI